MREWLTITREYAIFQFPPRNQGRSLEFEVDVIVRVQLTGPITTSAFSGKGEVALEEGATVETLLQTLGFRQEQLRFFRVAVGDVMASRSTRLHDSDEVTVMLPIGGG